MRSEKQDCAVRRVQDNDIYIHPRWDAYSNIELDPSIATENAPREAAIACARLYAGYQLERLAKSTGVDLSTIKIPEDAYVVIAAKAEKLAVNICKELSKSKK